MASQTTSTQGLAQRKCQPCFGAEGKLSEADVSSFLPIVSGWELSGEEIVRTFEFKNHYETMAFANAVAWISHREDHHPQMQIGYSTCRLVYSTHSVGGLSENDFICAAKVNALVI